RELGSVPGAVAARSAPARPVFGEGGCGQCRGKKERGVAGEGDSGFVHAESQRGLAAGVYKIAVLVLSPANFHLANVLLVAIDAKKADGFGVVVADSAGINLAAPPQGYFRLGIALVKD